MPTIGRPRLEDAEKALRAARIEAVRKMFFRTQGDLAAASGLARVDISKTEGGKNLVTSAALQGALARAYGVPAEALSAYLDGAISLEAFVERSTREPLSPEDGAPPLLLAAIELLGDLVSLDAVNAVLEHANKVTEKLTKDGWVAKLREAQAIIRGKAVGIQELGDDPEPPAVREAREARETFSTITVAPRNGIPIDTKSKPKKK